MELSSISIAITSLVGALFSPGAMFTTGVNGAWYDPSDINLTWRRNLLTYSEQFDNAAWVKANATVTANAAVAPDGTMTADKLVESVGVTRGLVTQSILTAVGNTISVYAKAAEWNRVCVGITNGSGLWGVAVFNLVNGTVDGGASYVEAVDTATITSVGNGWYRCSVRVAAGTSHPVIMPFNQSGDPVNPAPALTGDGTSGIYIWGAQLEQGSTATPYQRITDGIKDYLQYQAQPVLYQDAAGTTPVTAVEQPVGLMLDKSKGLVLGPELVTNGDFSNGATGWTLGAGWSVSAGKAQFAPGAIGSIYQAGMTIGKWYKVTYTVDSISGSWVRFNYGVAGTNRTAPGTYSQVLLAAGSFIEIQADSTTTATIDNISVRELPGNHAFNPSGNSANFPVLQQDGTGRYYLAFNGVNQWMQTNSIEFTYGDKMFVAAGVRKLSDAGSAIVCELSTSADTNSKAFYLAAPAGTARNYQIQTGAVGARVFTSYLTYTAPITNVIASQINNAAFGAAEITTKINGIAVIGSSNVDGAGASGNFGNYPFYIGARAGTSLFFNGLLYGLVVAGKAASASEIASTETWLNQKTGAY